MTTEAPAADPAVAPGGRAAATRARVLDAAQAVFTEQTYGGAAVPAVAARAGVAVGSVYRGFTGKEELANAVFRRAKSRMLAAVTAEHDPAAPVREQVLAMWRGLAAYAAADPEGFAFLEHQQHAAYLDDESLALSAQVEAAAASVLAAGQRSGEVREGDPAVLVALVFGAFVGLTKALRAAADHGGPDLTAALTPDLVESTGDAAWALLAAKETA